MLAVPHGAPGDNVVSNGVNWCVRPSSVSPLHVLFFFTVFLFFAFLRFLFFFFVSFVFKVIHLSLVCCLLFEAVAVGVPARRGATTVVAQQTSQVVENHTVVAAGKLSALLTYVYIM